MYKVYFWPHPVALVLRVTLAVRLKVLLRLKYFLQVRRLWGYNVTLLIKKNKKNREWKRKHSY